MHLVDRGLHFGASQLLPLELYDAEPYEGETYLAHATVYLRQPYREAEPTIWLGREDTDKGFTLTLREARTLGELLLDLVEQGGVGSADPIGEEATR